MGKELESFVIVKNTLIKYPDDSAIYEVQSKSLDTVEKGLKALEIIKNKKVDCNTLIFYLEKHAETGHIDYAFDSYKDFAKDTDMPQLTQEEYKILKEVLINVR